MRNHLVWNCLFQREPGKLFRMGEFTNIWEVVPTNFIKKMVNFLWPKEGFFVPNAPVQWFEKQNEIQKKFFWDTPLSRHR